MKKFILLIACAITHYAWAQPTTLGVGAGVGGNNTNSYFGVNAGAISTGSGNTFIAYGSGLSNTTGQQNTFLGFSSGSNNTASYNTFLGSQSGNSNTSGDLNVFVGTNSGQDNTTGNWNTFIGQASGFSNTTGTVNTFVGRISGRDNTTGHSNSFFGQGSGASNTTGIQNVFIGRSSGHDNETGSGNVFLGCSAGYSELGSNKLYIANSITPNPLIWGDFFTGTVKVSGTLGVGLAIGVNPSETIDVIGTARLRGVAQDETLTRMLFADANGSVRWRDLNTLPQVLGDNFGDHEATESITANADGSYDIGSLVAAFDNLYFDGSLFLDNAEFLHNTSSSVALGVNALPNVTTGLNNVAIGSSSLPITTTGSSNTAIGYNAGPFLPWYNVLSNTTAIGSQARPTASNMVRVGNSSVTHIGGYVDWTDLSDRRFKENIEENNVPGLQFINELKTVTYEVNRKKLGEFLHEDPTDNSQTIKAKREAGLIAQEVQEIVTRGNYVFGGVYKPENETHDTYGLQYGKFVAPLIKAVQELSAEVNALREEVNVLKSNQLSDANARTSSSTSSLAETIPYTSTVVGVKLEQNHPNPFDATTTINMNLPDEVKSARIVVFDLRGEQLLSQVIQGRGATSMKIEGKKLKPGMYLYTLVVNGEIADTRRMLVTE